jgi:hypothetical protein
MIDVVELYSFRAIQPAAGEGVMPYQSSAFLTGFMDDPCFRVVTLTAGCSESHQ